MLFAAVFIIFLFIFLNHIFTQTPGDLQSCRPAAALTFQLADLRLTVRPLLVTVHFILMKKSMSVLSSLPFLPNPLPETHTILSVKFDLAKCDFGTLH